MKTVVCFINMFDFEQHYYLIENNTIVSSFTARTDDLNNQLVYACYSLNANKLCITGNAGKLFINGVVEGVKQREFEMYKENKIEIEVK